MNKWLLVTNGKRKEFINFSEATKEFEEEIKRYMDSDVMAFDMPFNVGAYFSYLRNNLNVNTEVVGIIESNIRYLLSSIYRKPVTSYDDKILHYHGEIDDISESADIDIDKDKLHIKHEDCEGFVSYIITNAYLLNENGSRFYFDSRQKVTTTSNKDMLDKVLTLEISLERIN